MFGYCYGGTYTMMPPPVGAGISFLPDLATAQADATAVDSDWVLLANYFPAILNSRIDLVNAEP